KDAEKLMNGLSPHHKKTADSLLAEMSQDTRRNSVKLRNCNFAENRVPSGPQPDPEFPHFSNVTSVTAGGFFKARRRGNLHNVLPARSKPKPRRISRYERVPAA
ncbi:hypothetical protein TNCT_90191, partial [Trichonephila clavata]